MNCVELFICTLKNERYLSSFDETFYHIYDRYIYKDHLLPNFIKKNIAAIRLFTFFFNPCYLLFLLYSFVVVASKVLIAKKATLSSDVYFLATDNFSYLINKKICKYAQDAIWLLNSNINHKTYNMNGNRYVSLYNLLSFSDICRAFVDSITVCHLVRKRYSSYYQLFTLNSFKWLLYNKVACKIPYDSTIYFIDHKDRWAYLIDNLNIKNKIFIQHGIETTKTAHPLLIEYKTGRYCQDMPNKMGSITKVLTFSEEEYSALTHSIISNHPEMIVVGFGFEMSEITNDTYSILIIGCAYLYSNVESILIERLHHLNIKLFLKNHPTQDPIIYQALLQRYHFTLINRAFFPKVNLVISYNSTLAEEYKSVGVDVIYHTEKSINEIEQYVVKSINTKHNSNDKCK